MCPKIQVYQVHCLNNPGTSGALNNPVKPGALNKIIKVFHMPLIIQVYQVSLDNPCALIEIIHESHALNNNIPWYNPSEYDGTTVIFVFK